MNQQIISPDVFERHWTVSEPSVSVIAFLAQQLPTFSKSRLKLVLKYGSVWRTVANSGHKPSRIRRAKSPLKNGDEIHLYYNEALILDSVTPARLVSDEGEYSVWDKPSGMMTQPSKWCEHRSIARWVELFGLKSNQLQQRPCFMVHRLDRATNGLILIAHSKKAATKLASLFESRNIEKTYQATVRGCFPFSGTTLELQNDIDGKSAQSTILGCSYDPQSDRSLLTIRLDTGRKHQIRRHLAATGFAVIGDRLYGNENLEKNDADLPDLMLTSYQIRFECPWRNSKKTFVVTRETNSSGQNKKLP